jgi:mannobiose 2-epimerase
LRELTLIMLDKILDPSTMHLHLFLDEDWTPRSDEISFGHDIEFSWLLVEAAETLGDEALIARAKDVAVKIAVVTNAQGVDADGGVFGEAVPSGVTNFNKEWWPQAESVVGFMNAYQISGDPAFFADSKRSWDFIGKRLVDHKLGGWFHLVSRDGQPDGGPKISFWKCPYHNSRACMELIDRLKPMLPAGGETE